MSPLSEADLRVSVYLPPNTKTAGLSPRTSRLWRSLQSGARIQILRRARPRSRALRLPVNNTVARRRTFKFLLDPTRRSFRAAAYARRSFRAPAYARRQAAAYARRRAAAYAPYCCHVQQSACFFLMKLEFRDARESLCGRGQIIFVSDL